MNNSLIVVTVVLFYNEASQKINITIAINKFNAIILSKVQCNSSKDQSILLKQRLVRNNFSALIQLLENKLASIYYSLATKIIPKNRIYCATNSLFLLLQYFLQQKI